MFLRINNNKRTFLIMRELEQHHLIENYKGVKLYSGALRGYVLAGRDILKQGTNKECEALFNKVKNKLDNSHKDV